MLAPRVVLPDEFAAVMRGTAFETDKFGLAVTRGSAPHTASTRACNSSSVRHTTFEFGDAVVLC